MNKSTWGEYFLKTDIFTKSGWCFLFARFAGEEYARTKLFMFKCLNK